MEASNLALGILIFTLGGLAGGVFYLPFKKGPGQYGASAGSPGGL